MLIGIEWNALMFRSGTADVNILFKLHLFFGITLFLVFPFSRLVHVWSAPLDYVARPYQIVRKR